MNLSERNTGRTQGPKRSAVRGAIVPAVAVLLVSVISLVGCSRPDTIVVTGSSTVAPMMQEIARAYSLKNPGSRIQVQAGGSSRGVADARSGLAGIGMASRGAGKTEQDLVFHRIAYDGITIITHKANPIHDITRKQLLDIYAKKSAHWRDLAAGDKPNHNPNEKLNNKKIVVVHKAEGRATLELFVKYLNVPNSSLKPDIIIGDNEQAIKTVVGNEAAIAYVSIGSARYAVKSGQPIKLLSVDGIAATSANVKSGRFPISRTLNLITRKSAGVREKHLVDFALSSSVKAIIKSHYFIPPRS